LTPRLRDSDDDGDPQIPRRNARDIPDIQIILMDELDRGFVGWVEGELRARGIKTDVMLLSQRLSFTTVIRRQILEGVLAVTQLTRRSQDNGKIPLQVFDRKGGANNVRFDEYQDLEPKIVAELVLRAKQAQATVPSTYGQPQFMAGQPYQQTPTATTTTPNLASLVGQLDNSALQKLLGTLNAAAPPSQSSPTTNPTIDLAGILGGLARQQPPQQGLYQSLSQPPNNAYAALNNNDNLASLLGNAISAQAQPQQQSAQQVQNIMAQLAKFRQ
jgi:nuclear polyadenylated RNA-binding protein 3